jgi:hypothetical protein
MFFVYAAQHSLLLRGEIVMAVILLLTFLWLVWTRIRLDRVNRDIAENIRTAQDVSDRWEREHRIFQ